MSMEPSKRPPESLFKAIFEASDESTDEESEDEADTSQKDNASVGLASPVNQAQDTPEKKPVEAPQQIVKSSGHMPEPAHIHSPPSASKALAPKTPEGSDDSSSEVELKKSKKRKRSSDKHKSKEKHKRKHYKKHKKKKSHS